jgi:hypothetical protein
MTPGLALKCCLKYPTTRVRSSDHGADDGAHGAASPTSQSPPPSRSSHAKQSPSPTRSSYTSPQPSTSPARAPPSPASQVSQRLALSAAALLAVELWMSRECVGQLGNNTRSSAAYDRAIVAIPQNLRSWSWSWTIKRVDLARTRCTWHNCSYCISAHVPHYDHYTHAHTHTHTHAETHTHTLTHTHTHTHTHNHPYVSSARSKTHRRVRRQSQVNTAREASPRGTAWNSPRLPH